MPDIIVSEKGVCKFLAKEIAPALTLLFNRSLAAGQVLQSWKHALVQPIFKTGDRREAANYWPISLTSICCKLLEHIVRSEITSLLNFNNIITDAQQGFHKKRSCKTQLILTVDDLASEIDKGQADMILLELSKAFDRVPHQRLLLKLRSYGITGNTNKWIQNFLINRTQQLVIEGQHSYTGAVTSGVLQGSVLGPTVFLIYINNLGDGIKSTIRLFADDTILYNTIKTATDSTHLQDDIRTLKSWEGRWQMAFNEAKCHQLTVTKKRTKISTSYKLHNQTLDKVTSAKYLGIEITENLHWGKHIQETTAKANKVRETSRDAQQISRHIAKKALHDQC